MGQSFERKESLLTRSDKLLSKWQKKVDTITRDIILPESYEDLEINAELKKILRSLLKRR